MLPSAPECTLPAVRAVLPACLLVLAVTAGCAGPFDDGGDPESFQRMDDFSAVLVGKGLLTAGPAPADATAIQPESTDAESVLQLAVQDAEPADVPALPAGVAARVRGALNPAAPAIRRQVTQVNDELEAGNGRDAAPALQRLTATNRALATALTRIDGAPESVTDLAADARAVSNAARDLRAALLNGPADAAQPAAQRYAERAAQANALVAGLKLQGWPADRRLYP